MTSTFIVQIASVPGYQVGQRRFEQSRYLHELLINSLMHDDQKISALLNLVPQHQIVLRSGFSQTAQWGLEPNMFLQIHGNEKQARMISALFGQAFCQDGIGIGGGGVEGENHSVFIIHGDWSDENERLNFVSMILQQFPRLSAQLDVDGHLTFHDYSSCQENGMKSSMEKLLSNLNLSVEEQQMRSELIDRTEYEDLLMSLESRNAHRALNSLRYAHAKLFSGYPCGFVVFPKFFLRQQRRRQRRARYYQENNDQIERHSSLIRSAPHLCAVGISSSRVCMCLTDYNCFCHYTFDPKYAFQLINALNRNK